MLVSDLTGFRIDASQEDGSFGRLINDDHRNPNCKVIVQNACGEPVLHFCALRDIQRGEEILYNYGPGPYSWRPSRLH